MGRNNRTRTLTTARKALEFELGRMTYVSVGTWDLQLGDLQRVRRTYRVARRKFPMV